MKNIDISRATKAARASIPSIKLKAFVNPAIAKYVKGRDNTPSWTVVYAKFGIADMIKPSEYIIITANAIDKNFIVGDNLFISSIKPINNIRSIDITIEIFILILSSPNRIYPVITAGAKSKPAPRGTGVLWILLDIGISIRCKLFAI